MDSLPRDHVRYSSTDYQYQHVCQCHAVNPQHVGRIQALISPQHAVVFPPVTHFPGNAWRQVPDYLVSRQEEWEREEIRRKAEAPDPSCPPGMKLMPEDERLQTLKQLQVRK